jgi:hypothetical protein
MPRGYNIDIEGLVHLYIVLRPRVYLHAYMYTP